MENPSFFLEGIVHEKNELQDFEGPLSLILMLLQKNKIEIRDIKIADILDQYLEYLNEMQSMDLEVASEFVQMASYLLYIKTKTLLASDEQEVSELELLITSLEQLKAKDAFSQLQQIIPTLKKQSEHGMLYFTKLPEPVKKQAREYEYRHEPQELLKAVYDVFSRGIKSYEGDDRMASAIPKRIVYSVRDKSRQILNLLRTGSFALKELYSSCSSASELVAAFMSVLELCSMGSINIERNDNDYTVSFAGGDIDEIIEKIVE